MSRSLDAARSFLERLEAQGGREGAVLAGEFSDIQARSASWKTHGVCSTEAGCQPGNARKNRYKDVLPYDQTRVVLSLLREEGHGDYINGNFIRGADGSQAYIATQGPLPHTLLDFWRLVWEFRVKVILMACQETENGRKRCERYWAQEHEPLQIGLFCITLTNEKWLNADIMLRTLKVTFQKESRSVHQLQFMSWPDHGVPSSPDHMLAMVEEAHRLQGSGPGPLCVHCSAGCGRTGVLCVVDYVRQLLLTQTIPSNFSLFDVVLEMRRQRPSAVQTKEQYSFLYHTVAQMFRSAIQNASPSYQNLKENGAPLYDDALSLRTSPSLLAIPRPPSPGGVLSSSTICWPFVLSLGSPPPGDFYPSGPTASASEGGPRRARPLAVPACLSGPGVEARGPALGPPSPAGAAPGSPTRGRISGLRGLPELSRGGRFLPAAPAEQSPAGSGAYEDVAGGVQAGGLGFNLRIGRPKGPRDPPAEWTRV
ncbi:tyrosine-protein phosphatase non-receptor type 18 [Carlito syrichta]|uniref:protein-tyrosine-phosphatase n=1 Tax=Carlito syrichta TaxID=1868482 RepID=A0A3Q0DVX3_CARSF|nr:tyrosine-protein phosphatase non-receptor type 18 [Carlito syrichta]